MGEHICVGWLLVAERPLPEMSPFNLRRREADLRGVHSVTVHPLSAADGELLPQHAWDTAVQLDDVLRASIGTKPRQGFCEIAAALLTEYGVRFVPALAPLPLRADEPEGFFTPPEHSTVAALGPAEWRVLGSLLRRQPAHKAVLEALAEAGVGAEEMREIAVQAQREAQREAQRAVREGKPAGGLPTVEGVAAEEAEAEALAASAASAASAVAAVVAAAAAVARADALAQRIRRRLQGRVVVTPHTGADHVCNDVDFVRCAASLMPRRSKRDRLTSFQEYHQTKYGLALRHPQLPLLTVGVHLCACNCRIDEQHASAQDHFGAARDEARAHMPAEQLRHHTFLVAEHAVLLGLTAEMSPSYVSVLLPPNPTPHPHPHPHPHPSPNPNPNPNPNPTLTPA